jgi:hypothetical protein
MKTFLVSLMMLGAASAFANEAADEQHNRQTFQSVTTRAAVQTDYLAARSNGTLPVTSEAASLQVQAPTGAKSSPSRADVKLEARQAARTRVIQESI